MVGNEPNPIKYGGVTDVKFIYLSEFDPLNTSVPIAINPLLKFNVFNDVELINEPFANTLVVSSNE